MDPGRGVSVLRRIGSIVGGRRGRGASLRMSDAKRRRAMLGMLRMTWPIWLAGWFNRRKKRQSVCSCISPSSALDVADRDDATTTTVPVK